MSETGSTPKHTVDEGHIIGVYAGHDEDFSAPVCEVRRAADAALLAAAPDLLAALEAQGHEPWTTNSGVKFCRHCMAGNARWPCTAAQAIAKARGGTV